MASQHQPPHIRNQSLSGTSHGYSGIGGAAAGGSGQSPVLMARINEKRKELEDLKELRDLSGQLASQMQALEDRLSTLATGTEAVATVLGNWDSVLRAIRMASMKIPRPNVEAGEPSSSNADTELPQTLVRIPVQQIHKASIP